MENGIERRRHIRAPLHVPFTLITARGHFKEKTRDISVSGFSAILPFEVSEIENEFQSILRSTEEYLILVDCKKMWSDSITVHDTILIGIGVQFTKISPKDHKIIASLIEDFYRA